MNVHPTRVSLEYLVQIELLHSVVDHAQMDIQAMEKTVPELTEVSTVYKDSLKNNHGALLRSHACTVTNYM